MVSSHAPRFCVGTLRTEIRKTATLWRQRALVALYCIAAFAMSDRQLRATLGSAKSVAVFYAISKAYRVHVARTLHVPIIRSL